MRAAGWFKAGRRDTPPDLDLRTIIAPLGIRKQARALTHRLHGLTEIGAVLHSHGRFFATEVGQRRLNT
ncbi:hypothetical protein Busp01_12010 [Trinickia caryophylli]|uniref:Uncharacterized protein n=1 Tax=Trinickia caryophylli TaxID=28094 RepID=A0A1X7D787_TRICW|nr:hypothetical protein C0Z17_07380 [Trinickia caryophylli]GLU31359.1 hypothetical protein Busp01_12010 [Trinickia caryophylli]SMF10190.1 hypothetical protein SAMN06295900_102486 [Trinickia caryophylli]